MSNAARKTMAFTRHHGWEGKPRIQSTIRVPKELHKKIVKQALRHKMTINDYMIAAVEVVLNRTT